MINLIGLLLPPIIDLINRRIVDEDARFWVSVLICSLTGLIVAYIDTNGFAGYKLLTDYVETIAKEIMMMFGIAQLVYKGLYKDSPVQKLIRN